MRFLKKSIKIKEYEYFNRHLEILENKLSILDLKENKIQVLNEYIEYLSNKIILNNFE